MWMWLALVVALLLIQVATFVYVFKCRTYIRRLIEENTDYRSHINQLRYGDREVKVTVNPKESTTTLFKKRMQTLRGFDYTPTPPTGHAQIVEEKKAYSATDVWRQSR
jgi:NADH:ubiquinone oxidoreductase subunit D